MRINKHYGRFQPWNNREKERVFDVPGIRVDVRLLTDELEPDGSVI